MEGERAVRQHVCTRPPLAAHLRSVLDCKWVLWMVAAREAAVAEVKVGADQAAVARTDEGRLRSGRGPSGGDACVRIHGRRRPQWCARSGRTTDDCGIWNDLVRRAAQLHDLSAKHKTWLEAAGAREPTACANNVLRSAAGPAQRGPVAIPLPGADIPCTPTHPPSCTRRSASRSAHPCAPRAACALAAGASI